VQRIEQTNTILLAGSSKHFFRRSQPIYQWCGHIRFEAFCNCSGLFGFLLFLLPSIETRPLPADARTSYRKKKV